MKTCEYLLQKVRRLWFDSCWSGYGIAFDPRESIWISCEFGLDLAIIFGLVCDFYGLFRVWLFRVRIKLTGFLKECLKYFSVVKSVFNGTSITGKYLANTFFNF